MTSNLDDQNFLLQQSAIERRAPDEPVSDA